MNIKGDKIKLNKSDVEIFEIFSKPSYFKKIIPKENLTKFESTDESFTFSLKGMPEISLKIKESIPNNKIVFVSGKSSMDFELILDIEKIDESNSFSQFLFEGKFNSFISMMVDKPLNNFIKSITQGLNEI